MIPGASLTVIFVPSAIKSPPLKDTILSTACQCRINFFSPKKRGGVNDSFFQFLQYFYLLLWLSNENLPLFISSTESFSKSQSTKHPLGGVVVPPKAPSRKGGRFAALLGFAQPGGSAAVRGACGPHTRGAPGPGPRGAPGSARRPPPSPAARSQAPGLQRYFGPPSAPRVRLASPASGGLAPRPLGLRPPLRGAARFVPRSLARPIGAGGLRLARRALPPWGRACGRGLGPGSAPFGWLRPGPLCALRLARPPGLCGLPAGVVGLGPLRAWPCAPGPAPGPPWPAPPPSGGWVLALRGSARLVAPRGRRGPLGRFGRLRRPRGLGDPLRGFAAYSAALLLMMALLWVLYLLHSTR